MCRTPVRNFHTFRRSIAEAMSFERPPTRLTERITSYIRREHSSFRQHGISVVGEGRRRSGIGKRLHSELAHSRLVTWKRLAFNASTKHEDRAHISTAATTPPVRFPPSQEASPTLIPAAVIVANISIQPKVFALLSGIGSRDVLIN